MHLYTVSEGAAPLHLFLMEKCLVNSEERCYF